jgi:hypothetical protein
MKNRKANIEKLDKQLEELKNELYASLAAKGQALCNQFIDGYLKIGYSRSKAANAAARDANVVLKAYIKVANNFAKAAGHNLETF